MIKSVHPYWTDAPAGYSRYGDTLTYEWEPVGDGRFWLRRLEKTYHKPGTEPYQIYLLEISDFDPNPAIPKDRFTFESLGVKDGTTVYVYRGREKSEYVQGKPQPEGITQEDLDRLAEEVRQKGFANPKP